MKHPRHIPPHTMQELHDLCRTTGGGITKVVMRGNTDIPYAAWIVVDGEQETTDVLEALAALEQNWEADQAECRDDEEPPDAC